MKQKTDYKLQFRINFLYLERCVLIGEIINHWISRKELYLGSTGVILGPVVLQYELIGLTNKVQQPNSWYCKRRGNIKITCGGEIQWEDLP